MMKTTAILLGLAAGLLTPARASLGMVNLNATAVVTSGSHGACRGQSFTPAAAGLVHADSAAMPLVSAECPPIPSDTATANTFSVELNERHAAVVPEASPGSLLSLGERFAHRPDFSRARHAPEFP